MRPECLTAAKLKENAFELEASEHVRIWAGRPEIKTLLEEIVRTTLTTGFTELVYLYGEYGSGKTHSLRYLQYLITEKEAADFRSLVIYVPTVLLSDKATFQDVYRYVITQLGKSGMQTIAKRISDSFEKAVRERHEFLQNTPEKLAEIVRRNPNVQKEIENELAREMCPKFPELVGVIKKLASGDELAWRFLSGEAMKDQHSVTLGVSQFASIDTDWACFSVLSALFNLLTMRSSTFSGFPIYVGVYLFQDEWEETYTGGKGVATITSLESGYRGLVDGCPARLCLIMSYTGSAAAFSATVADKIQTRLSRKPIYIGIMEFDEAYEFLKDYLTKFRTENTTPEHPFDAEGLKELINRTLPNERTPRILLRNCRIALEKACAEKLIDSGAKISRSDVARYFP
jgi:hypothetical protein